MVYDLAICLNAWAFDGESEFNPAKAAALVQAYQARRPLSEAERLALPVLARGSALRFLLTRLYDWLNQQPGALVRPKDPREYLRKLRFHRTISHAEQYGL
jgi:homoserine kinase type II